MTGAAYPATAGMLKYRFYKGFSVGGRAMGEDESSEANNLEHPPQMYHERREYARREGSDRRGPLRWDPRATEKQRRGDDDRRRLN